MNTITSTKVRLVRRTLSRADVALGNNAHDVKGAGNQEIGKADQFRKAKVIGSRYGLCGKTIARWAAQGLIRRYKVNARVVLYSSEEVEAFVQASRV